MATGQVNQIENIKHLKPQKEWGWQVAVYLFLAGIGAGSLAFGILMDWLGYAPHPLRPMLLWGPILVAIGALFLVLKLGIKRRFLNTILNPKTSWLSRGFYILSMCIVVGALILGITLLPFLGVSISDWSSLILVLEIIGFILALATAVYTGILIQSVKYVPFWNTPLLPALFTVSALSTGAITTNNSTLYVRAEGNYISSGNISTGSGSVRMRASSGACASATINGNITIDSGAILDEAAITMTLSSGSIFTVNGTLDFTSSTGLVRTGNNVNATLVMGSAGLIKTFDDSGIGPGTNASLQNQDLFCHTQERPLPPLFHTAPKHNQKYK